jgi:TolA-binding protein
MDNSEHKIQEFEKELSKGINEAAVDYNAVELKLFDRICHSADIGELCVLKADIIKPIDYFEDVEKTLTQNIAQYREYEEPIDECINQEVDLSGAQWERLESKLNERIYAVHDLPLWELNLKIAAECSEQVWDKVEGQLFDRIDSLKKGEKWEEYAKSDEVAIPVNVERVEQQLEQRIENQPVNAWEQVLKTEEILPYKKWEECEDALFERIENQNNLGKMPFWFVVEGYVSTLKKYSAVAVSLLLILIGTVAYIKVNKVPQQVASIVYQLQGEAVLHSELATEQQNAFHSVNGGSVTFVNTHGVVTMQNESVVALEQISNNKVRYKVGFKEKSAAGHNTSAKVAFFVHKKTVPDAFKVETPDYQIIVKGTYFKVEPDISGRVSTRVLEGVVKIHSNDFGDTVLYAGQSLMYDMFSNRYKIHSSGPVIARSEIEKLPEMVDLLKYGIVKIVSAEVDAEVTIDGKVFGHAPIAVRQPFGLHRVIVKKEGFAGFDTTIDLEQGSGAIEVTATLQKIEKPVVVPVKPPLNKVPEEKTVVQPVIDTEAISPEIVAEKMLGADPEIQKVAEQNYFAAQKAELAGKWNDAVARYQEVFNSEGSSKLRKEDALFSIGKIRAEHEKEPSEGKQVFLKYLALFPDGSFSGECWLRLAELEFRSNPENAIQYYTRFFEMFPMHPRLAELKNRVGVIYLQRKRYRDAISMFRSALSNCGLSQDAEKVRITGNLQKALEESGDSDSADLLRKELRAESR